MNYYEVLGWLVAGRVCDMLSTWLATPDLRRESNLYARRIGWWGILILNAMVCPLLALWGPLGTMVAAVSFMLAGGNCVAAMNWRYNVDAAWLLVGAMVALGVLAERLHGVVGLALIIYALIWAGRHLLALRRTVWLEKQRKRRAVRLQ